MSANDPVVITIEGRTYTIDQIISEQVLERLDARQLQILSVTLRLKTAQQLADLLGAAQSVYRALGIVVEKPAERET